MVQLEHIRDIANMLSCQMSLVLQTLLLVTLIRQSRFVTLPVLKQSQKYVDRMIDIGQWKLFAYQYGQGYEDLLELAEQNPESHNDFINTRTPDEIRSIAKELKYRENLTIKEIKDLLAEDPTFRWLLMLNNYVINPLLKGPIDTLKDAIIEALQISVPSMSSKLAYLIHNLPRYGHIVDTGIRTISPLGLNNVYESLSNYTDLQIYYILGVQDISHSSRKKLLERAYDIAVGNGDCYVVKNDWILYVHETNKRTISVSDIVEALSSFVLGYGEYINLSQIYYGLNLERLLTRYSSVLPGGAEWNEVAELAVEQGVIDNAKELMDLLNF